MPSVNARSVSAPSVGASAVNAPPVGAAIAANQALASTVAAADPWPSAEGPHLVVLTSRRARRVSIYDNAMVALFWLRVGRRSEAGRLLAALAQIQREDGSLPFSFQLPYDAAETQYIRSGAIAWVGYAATQYLDFESGGRDRERAAALAHRAAAYLLAHQVNNATDPRDGLVLGGSGVLRYTVVDGTVREAIVPGEVSWASTEHNIDAYFFLMDWARISGRHEYLPAAKRIAAALLQRAWLPDAGQLARGLDVSSVDAHLALDCASWGALFLLAVGERTRAETALAVAERRYETRDRATGAAGHRPHAHAPIFENYVLAQNYRNTFAQNDWDSVDAVWPEGTAGVALAEARIGDRSRAKRMLDALEPARTHVGGLPTLTREIPFEFDTEPSLAATAWVEIVRDELRRSPSRQSFLTITGSATSSLMITGSATSSIGATVP